MSQTISFLSAIEPVYTRMYAGNEMTEVKANAVLTNATEKKITGSAALSPAYTVEISQEGIALLSLGMYSSSKLAKMVADGDLSSAERNAELSRREKKSLNPYESFSGNIRLAEYYSLQ